MLNEYTLVSLGDHCALPIILKEAGIRKTSYPFDWISHKDHLYSTNIFHNVQLLKDLYSGADVKSIVEDFIGDLFDNAEKLNTKTQTWFPHDDGHKQEIIDKYERRFKRLYEDIRLSKTSFFMVTRHFYIDESKFNDILNFCLQLNPYNKIVFISGTDHPYLNNIKYKDKVIFRFIYYDVSKFYGYDYTDFRPKIKNAIIELF